MQNAQRLGRVLVSDGIAQCQTIFTKEAGLLIKTSKLKLFPWHSVFRLNFFSFFFFFLLRPLKIQPLGCESGLGPDALSAGD